MQHSQGANSEILLACVESSNDAIMLTYADGTIFYVNPAWQTLFGYSKKEIAGATPRILRSGRHDPDFYSAMWRDVLDPLKGHWKGEIINRTKSGREIHVLLTISPNRDNQGIVQGYMSIAVDISDKKKMEAQIQWQDRLATIGVLTSGLAHELGTPLGVIRGRAEYLSHHCKEASDKTSLEAIVTQVDRISALMHSLQNLSNLSPSEVRMPVSLSTTTKSATQLLKGKLEDLGIHLEISIPLEAKVSAEPGRLEYIILNLCLNSVQAIDKQVLEKRNLKHAIKIAVLDRGKNWEFSVQDSGGGVLPENLPHLFKPFFTTKEVGMGTGLGLSMIYQIVKSWGGSLELDNESGVGATFRIILPKVSK